MSNQIASLPIAERVRLYGQMARETSRLADEAQVPEARAMFQKLTHCWKALAEELAEESDGAEPLRLMAAE